MIDRLEDALSDAVAARMVADVPVGAFLSGGIDSSTVVALMQRHSSGPVRTFTVGFADRSFDESSEAAAVAAHLGTDHTTVDVGDAEAVEVISQLPDIWDEPFADVSQIPTYLVSRVARGKSPWRCLATAGTSCLRATTATPGSIECGGRPPQCRLGPTDRRLRSEPHPTFGRRRSSPGRGRPPGWLAECVTHRTRWSSSPGFLPRRDPEDAYRALTTHWADADSLVLGADHRDHPDNGGGSPIAGAGITEQMLWLDLVGYLPDDILVKLDRAAMAVSLETRVPFLDRRILELAWSLPLDAKLRAAQTKWVLRQVLQRHVPAALVERPKMGFGLPIGTWLRGELAPWAEHLLDERRLRDQGLLDPLPIRRAWGAPSLGPTGPGLRALGCSGPAVLDRPLEAESRLRGWGTVSGIRGRKTTSNLSAKPAQTGGAAGGAAGGARRGGERGWL